MFFNNCFFLDYRLFCFFSNWFRYWFFFCSRFFVLNPQYSLVSSPFS